MVINVVKAPESIIEYDFFIRTGLSGRKLHIPESWPVAIGASVRIGIKVAWELYPKSLVKRLRKERLKRFMVDDRSAFSSVMREMQLAQDASDTKLVKELEARMKLYAFWYYKDVELIE